MSSNLQDIWKNCLEILHKRTNRTFFEAFLSGSSLVYLKNGIAVIQVYDNFVKSRLESSVDSKSGSIYKEIVYALSEITGKKFC